MVQLRSGKRTSLNTSAEEPAPKKRAAAFAVPTTTPRKRKRSTVREEEAALVFHIYHDDAVSEAMKAELGICSTPSQHWDTAHNDKENRSPKTGRNVLYSPTPESSTEEEAMSPGSRGPLITTRQASPRVVLSCPSPAGQPLAVRDQSSLNPSSAAQEARQDKRREPLRRIKRVSIMQMR